MSQSPPSTSNPQSHRSKPKPRRNVAVITGTRAEFGLLTPVMRALDDHPGLRLQVVAGGAHLLTPARTIREVRAAFPVAATVPMQRATTSITSRHADALALARGVDGFARAFARLKPDWVVVLGDRIEAFAAAAAAAVAGLAVCHIHAGDRAEGIADESMRHAITKLAHLHCAATPRSARRVLRLGERPEHVHVTGSPGIDVLDDIAPMSAGEVASLGSSAARRAPLSPPRVVVLLHPSGFAPALERRFAAGAFGFARRLADSDRQSVKSGGDDGAVLAFAPNHDPGRSHVVRALQHAARGAGWRTLDHLPRPRFVALLKWMAAHHVPLVGNSSAGLIECAALGVPVINLGPRQAGRERFANVLDIPDPAQAVPSAARWLAGPARRIRPTSALGDAHAARHIAELLARTNPSDAALLRKRITY